MKGLYIAWFCLTAQVLMAQGDQPFFREFALIPFQLTEKDGEFVPQWDRQDIRFTTDGFKPYRIDTIFFSGADLKVHFSPKQLYQAVLDYEVASALVDGGDKLWLGSEKHIVLDQPFSLSWNDIAERPLYLNETYKLLLEIGVYGEVCQKEPAFGLNKKLPYFAGAIGGVALIGAGQIYRSQAHRKYDQYEEDWLTEPEGNYEPIQNDLNTAKVLTYGGTALVIADALIYFLVPRKQYRLAKKRYEVYCSDRAQLTVAPFVNPDTELGIKLKLSF